MIDKRIYEQFNKHSKAPFKLEDATILVLAQIGSHSHGTYIPPEDPTAIDDVDYMGVIIPPPSFTFGLREWDGLKFAFEELDCVFYSFRKFVNLLIKSNPNVLGLMWLREEEYIHTEPELWDWVLNHRQDFASERALEAFVGYADSQLTKMTHFDIHAQNTYDTAVKIVEAAGWTVEQIVKGLPRDMPDMKAVSELLDGYSAGCHPDDRTPGTDREELKQAARDVRHTHAKYFQGYMGEKRKKLIRKYGYDTKNASHLIRILRMLVEYLNTGKLQVYRTDDAEYLKDIKRGAYSLDYIKEAGLELLSDAENASKRKVLPDEPSFEAIDQLVQDVYLRAYRLERFHCIK
jgi:predicted nucleotidyltransferase